MRAISALIFVFMFAQVSVPVVNAIAAINVNDVTTQVKMEKAAAEAKAQREKNTTTETTTSTQNSVSEKLQEAMKWVKDQSQKAGFKNIVGTALNTVAYDTATYLGSGGKGQEPMFIKEGWGEYLMNVGDQAMGQFIEEFAKEIGLENACNPKLALKIVVGMKAIKKPSFGKCSFSKMAASWEKAITSANFLNDIQSVFDVDNSTTGVSLALNTNIKLLEKEIDEKEKNILKRKGGDKKPPTDAAKRAKTPEFAAEKLFSEPFDWYRERCADASGDDVIMDAVYVFICQFSYTAFVTLMMSILADKPTITGPYSGNYDFEANPAISGVSGTNQYMKSILEPNFSVDVDYEILNELSVCPDPTRAGPTNCVINDDFREAIVEKKTIAEALESGELKSDGVFGYLSGSTEPSHEEGYPHRSMKILRKFRILPVGWELAAEYIKNNNTGTVTLQTLVDCYSPTDKYGGPGTLGEWCEGLVDPDWVLKAPSNTCKKRGPGPELLDDLERPISRLDTYCADEQACILEDDNGGCERWGYCTQERRTWDFDAGSCEPRFNSCETFQGVEGDQVSYLKNTLEVCSENDVGCLGYALTGAYDAGEQNVSWNGDKQIYFNQKVGVCEPDQEGCHEFIRKFGTYEEQTIYQKLLPEYLEDTCYKGSGAGISADEFYNYKTDLDSITKSICEQYVRQCNAQEVGCELFTDALRGDKIPAKITVQNECPAECVGFDTYQQRETYFEDAGQDQFIPEVAQACSLEMVGCDTFTNLDEVALGGEGLEYYIDLRQCVDPDDLEGASCTNYYIWEQLSTGPQLKVLTLKAATNGAPVTTNGITGDCTGKYNLEPTDVDYSPDCQEFLDESGNKHYKYYSKTRTCSDDCHTYRRAGNNIDSSITTSGACSGVDRGWSANEGACVVCKNSGTWNASQGACLYNAIPGEGRTCAPQFAGCREYTGSQAANVREIVKYDFEDYLGSEWIEGERSDVSLLVDGHSVYGANKISFKLNSSILPESTYIASFYAKPVSSSGLKLQIDNFSVNMSSLVQGEWQRVETIFSLTEVEVNNLTERKVSIGYVDGSNGIYIDDLKLTEVVDRYYLMKETLADNIPESCHEEYWKLNSDAYPEPSYPFPNYSLGCREYTDRANTTHYLNEFTELCQETAVGCELMLDTHNFDSAESEAWNDVDGDGECGSDELSCVKVPEDSSIYVVYDAEKQCNIVDKGCQMLGQSEVISDSEFYNDIYVKNDPNMYFDTLCEKEDVGCQKWLQVSDNSYMNFKDPVSNICEYRTSAHTGVWDWYKKNVHRCDANSSGNIEAGEDQVCKEDSNCEAGSCIFDPREEECANDLNIPKTIGSGGVGSKVAQPIADGRYAAVCPLRQSTCTEYIDPMSGFNKNELINPTAEKLHGIEHALWDTYNDPAISGDNNGLRQITELSGNTLYVIEHVKEISCNGKLWTLEGKNSEFPEFENRLKRVESVSAFSTEEIRYCEGDCSSFSKSVIQVDTDSNIDHEEVRFYTGENVNKCLVIRADDKRPAVLNELVVEYRLAKDLKEQRECTDVNNDEGCVLFNERAWGDRSGVLGVSNLDYDATLVGTTGNNACISSSYTCDSNEIIKVSPNRVCDQWLSCRSMTTVNSQSGAADYPICMSVGLCDRFGPDGSCDNFITSRKENQFIASAGFSIPETDSDNFSALSRGAITNMTGYAKVGWDYSADVSEIKQNDFFKISAMSQAGGVANVPNGNFELTDIENYPIGWSIKNRFKDWDKGMAQVVNDQKVIIEGEGIGYPPSGEGVLRAGARFIVESESIEVEKNQTYILTFYANTLNLSAGGVKIRVLDVNGVELENAKSSVAGRSDDWQFNLFEFETKENNLVKIKLSAQRGAEDISSQTISTLSAGKGGGSGAIAEYLSTDACPDHFSDEVIKAEGYDDAEIAFMKGIDGLCAEGVYYFDNIALRPALESRKKEIVAGIDDRNWYIPQTCRLYPEEDSLSCRYIDDRGLTQKGIYGYCLEYDSYPGYSDACLMWYPVDRVMGDWIEEDVGYSGRFPMYYCSKATPYCQEGYRPGLFCTELIQTVNSVGDNKYWSGRHENSGYELSFADFSDGRYINWGELDPIGRQNIVLDKNADGAPFGGVVPPWPSSEPEEWKNYFGREITGLPVSHLPEAANEPRAGVPYYIIDDQSDGRYQCNTNKGTQCGWGKDDSCKVVKQIKDEWELCEIKSGKEVERGKNGCNISIQGEEEEQGKNPYKWELTAQGGGGKGGEVTCFAECFNEMDFNSPTTNVNDAVSGLQRIFAQSYDAWEWKPDYECLGGINDTEECTPECLGGGICMATLNVGTCKGSVNAGDVCDIDVPEDSNECELLEGRYVDPNTGQLCCKGGECENSGINFGYCDGGANSGRVCALKKVGETFAPYEYVASCGSGASCGDDDLCVKDPCLSTYDDDGGASSCPTPASVGKYCGEFNCPSGSCLTDVEFCVGGYSEGVQCGGGTIDAIASGTPVNVPNDMKCNGGICLPKEGSSGYKKINATPVGEDPKNWTPPETLCNGTGRGNRPNYPNDNCAIIPEIDQSTIKVDGTTSNVETNPSQMMNLSFNVKVNDEQLPLVMMTIDWGDGETDVITGARMRDRNSEENPFSFDHLYSYWDLRQKVADVIENGDESRYSSSISEIQCGGKCKNDGYCDEYNGNYCVAKPRIKVRDNWGWCNSNVGVNQFISQCDQWQEFDGNIVIMERDK